MAEAADQRRVWTAIAESFDRTRQRPWPHVEAFLAALPKDSRVLDLMAGNGRHGRAAVSLGHRVVSVDWSAPLLAKCPGDRVLADAAMLPLRGGTADAAVYAAGLHGLPNPSARAASLRELRRVLRPGAPAQVTVWSRDAPRFAGLGLPAGPADVVVPWRADGADAPRTYRLYTAPALRRELEEAGFIVEDVRGIALASAAADNLVAVVRGMARPPV